MAISRLEEKICSVKKTEDDGDGNYGLSLMYCLRGRLLAERQASRAAKDDAEFMVQKLIEMEKKLGEEIRLRDKAEKRLKFLRGKLETVSIPFSPTLEESEESRRLPITSGPEDAQLERAKSHVTKQETSRNSKIDLSNWPKSIDHSHTHETNLDWETGDFPAEKSSKQITAGDEESKIDDPRKCDHMQDAFNVLQSTEFMNSMSNVSSSSSSMLKASVAEPETQNEIDKEAHSSLALVPIKLPAKTQARETKITRKITSQALDPLIHAREKTQSSMERRHIVKALIC